MFDIPILGQRPAAPQPQRRVAGDPVLLDQSLLGGRGPRIAINQMHAPAGVFRKEQRAKLDLALARTISLILHRHYRGHFWAVSVDGHQGVALIAIPALMPRATHWIIKLKDIACGHDCTSVVMRAGGELLERYGIPTSSIDTGLGQFLEAKQRHRFSKLVPA